MRVVEADDLEAGARGLSFQAEHCRSLDDEAGRLVGDVHDGNHRADLDRAFPRDTDQRTAALGRRSGARFAPQPREDPGRDGN
jgi:hypothetical protein